jgi:hypothetical protein
MLPQPYFRRVLVPNEFPAMQRKLPPQDQAWPSSLSSVASVAPVPASASVTALPCASATPLSPAALSSTSAQAAFAPIAVTAKPRAFGWLQALLSGTSSVRTRLANIQQAMLLELGQVASLPLHEDALARQIVQASDAETLWELRRELSAAIAGVCGGMVAHQKMTEISFMFAGLLRRRSADDHDHPPGENVVRLPTRSQVPSASS